MSVMMKKLTHTQMIVLGYLIIILCGTVLLMMPAASRDAQPTPMVDAMFTSTSAVCVTGLVIADTWQKWSIFGQVVILTIIQIGGLGLSISLSWRGVQIGHYVGGFAAGGVYLIFCLVYIGEVVGVGAAYHPAVQEVGVLAPYLVQMPEVVYLCTSEGAVRGHESQV